MSSQGDLAARIRDIQLPDPIPVWPPAPGWWILLGLLLLAAITLAIRRHRRLAPRRAALQELERLTERYGSGESPDRLAAGLSILLRRTAMLRDSRRHVAGLVGEPWLSYLDRRGGTEQFSKGVGRALITVPYSGQGEADVDALVDLVRDWIRLNT